MTNGLLEENAQRASAGHSRMFGFLTNVLAVCMLTAFVASSWFIAREMHDLNVFLGVLLTALTVWFGLQGYQFGAAGALFSWGRFAACVAAGYLFGSAAGNAIGLGGFAASVTGFYLCAIAVFVFIGFLGKLVFAPNRIPGFVDKIAGLVLGAAEGVFLFTLASWVVSLYPPDWNQSQPAFPARVAEQVSGKLIEPLVPAQASGVVELFALARDARRGIDPQKIDHERLSAIFQPLRSNPRFQELAGDPELRSLTQQKDYVGLMKHPKVTALLNDKDFQTLANGIDLNAFSSIVRQAIKK
ncbi:MAG TPA: CvpA family protein [Candidatus Ozemobacteraceae bacterium]|nr:CvpA family protein [Candidatus Ozemobacteraceae bacterium]